MTTMKELAERMLKVEREVSYLAGRMAEKQKPVSIFPNGHKVSWKIIAGLFTVITALIGLAVLLVKTLG